MTKDELRKHCERVCARYAEANRVTMCLTYEEHKLVLDLLDRDISVLKALEDVRAEIEADKLDAKASEDAYAISLIESLSSFIDRKIAEVTHESTRSES